MIEPRLKFLGNAIPNIWTLLGDGGGENPLIGSRVVGLVWEKSRLQGAVKLLVLIISMINFLQFYGAVPDLFSPKCILKVTVA